MAVLAVLGEPPPDRAHFLYNASREGTDIWCLCRERFGTDEAAARAHIEGVAPDPLRDRARRLLAEYREYGHEYVENRPTQVANWMDEAAELLRQIAGEQ